MDERVIVQWTVTNWITIFLMATLGFVLLGFVAQAAHKMTGNTASG